VKGQYIQTDDIVLYLKNWLSRKIDEFCNLGFDLGQIIFDPGIGFGTTPEQSLTIIKNIGSFMDYGVKILLGHSNKSFLSVFGEENPNNRDPETNALTLYLAQAGVDYIRVHDVRASKRVMNLAEALR
jgi:dihydropteroate synthase